MTDPVWPKGLALFLTLTALSGCADVFEDEAPDRTTYAGLGYSGEPTGRNGTAWPDLGGTLRILDHGSFSAFDVAARQFENLTGVSVRREDFGDTGSSLNVAIREAGDPSFDVFYGIDNILYLKAAQSGALEAYKPLLASRIQEDLVFFDRQGTWAATPVDHGYIGVNWDRNTTDIEHPPIADLHDVRAHANEFVTEDPRLSSPGLGFLLATIATFGEPDPIRYDWKEYWADLFAAGVLVTPDWTTAYEQHFSAGYGVAYGGAGDRPIVTSYTESPAYEAFYGRPPEQIAGVVLAPESTFHQVQTMAVLKGTRNLAAAQAWIEFTLTDYFQELAAPWNAVYPAVEGVSVEDTFGGLDPTPCSDQVTSGCFVPAQLDAVTIGQNLDRWLDEWTELCEDHDCA